MRIVDLKGSGFRDILPKLGAMALIGLFLNTWATLNYRKTALKTNCQSFVYMNSNI
jgi:ABC-2 type transport system permease protein